MFKTLSLLAFLTPLMLLSGQTLADAAEGGMKVDVHEGKVVSVSLESLEMLDKDGKSHAHKLNPETKMTLDGKRCKPTDLKPSMRIRVTIREGEKPVVMWIEGLNETRRCP